MELDPDQGMAASALVDFFRCEKLSVQQYLKVKIKLRSLGLWTRKLIENHEKGGEGGFSLAFCVVLEFTLGTAFYYMKRDDVCGFWCDGLTHHYVSKKDLNDKRKIETTAWIGKEGEIVYQMTIYLGKYALRRCARGTSMIDCIPDVESPDWIDVEVKRRTIDIYLR